MSHHGFATRAIHDGQPADPLTGAVNVPIYASSTYAQEEIGKHRGYEYSRVSNPTRDALEENLASLEGGTSAHVFSSGMAAIPLEKTCADVPPSSEARFSSSAVRVGFETREYSYPRCLPISSWAYVDEA